MRTLKLSAYISICLLLAFVGRVVYSQCGSSIPPCYNNQASYTGHGPASALAPTVCPLCLGPRDSRPVVVVAD